MRYELINIQDNDNTLFDTYESKYYDLYILSLFKNINTQNYDYSKNFIYKVKCLYLYFNYNNYDNDTTIFNNDVFKNIASINNKHSLLLSLKQYIRGFYNNAGHEVTRPNIINNDNNININYNSMMLLTPNNNIPFTRNKINNLFNLFESNLTNFNNYENDNSFYNGFNKIINKFNVDVLRYNNSLINPNNYGFWENTYIKDIKNFTNKRYIPSKIFKLLIVIIKENNYISYIRSQEQYSDIHRLLDNINYDITDIRLIDGEVKYSYYLYNIFFSFNPKEDIIYDILYDLYFVLLIISDFKYYLDQNIPTNKYIFDEIQTSALVRNLSNLNNNININNIDTYTRIITTTNNIKSNTDDSFKNNFKKI